MPFASHACSPCLGLSSGRSRKARHLYRDQGHDGSTSLALVSAPTLSTGTTSMDMSVAIDGMGAAGEGCKEKGFVALMAINSSCPNPCPPTLAPINALPLP